MKIEMTSSNRLIVGMLLVAALGAAFWILLLSPKREEASKLGAEVQRLEASLQQHEAQIAEGEAARQEFPSDYHRLVVLGKAVPGDDDVASFLVQLNKIAERAGGTFQNIQLSSSGGGDAADAPPPAGGDGTPVSATEVAASLLPLGATIGPAGLAVMPYDVTFDGDFFEIADFIKGLDSLVKTGGDEVRVDGRLVTVNSFSLEANGARGFPALNASFSLTTYLTPPGEGSGSGESPGSGPATATPAATTTGGAR